MYVWQIRVDAIVGFDWSFRPRRREIIDFISNAKCDPTYVTTDKRIQLQIQRQIANELINITKEIK